MTFSELTALAPPAGFHPDAFPPPERTVAVAGAADAAVLHAVVFGRSAGIGFILVGDSRSIVEAAAAEGLDIEGCEMVPPDEPEGGEVSECRTAVRLCREGRCGVLMKGHVGTAAFTRAILDKEGGLTGEGALLSHVGLFADPRGESGSRPVFLLTDAAINIAPDIEAKKTILANAAAVARALGTPEPRIALLAPVEKVSPKIPSTSDAAALKQWAADGGLGGAIADGPFALDVAASAEAAKIKGLASPVAGQTDIYLAPNLDAGNVLYKALTVFAGARAAGILAGARVPVVLTSRSDSDEVKRNSLGLALRVAAAAIDAADSR